MKCLFGIYLMYSEIYIKHTKTKTTPGIDRVERNAPLSLPISCSCLQSGVRVAKTIRLRAWHLRHLRPWLRRAGVRVVHLVRDPRAIREGRGGQRLQAQSLDKQKKEFAIRSEEVITRHLLFWGTL